MLKKTIFTALAISMISGCSMGVKMPKDDVFQKVNQESIIKEKIEKLKQQPSLTHKKGYSPLIIEQPIVIPKNIREKYIEIEFASDATFKDLPELLKFNDIIAIIKNEVINKDGTISEGVTKEIDDFNTKRTMEIDDFIKENSVIVSSQQVNPNAQVINNVRSTDTREKYTYTNGFKRTLEKVKIGLPLYKGTFQGLLDMLASMHNISFNWQYGNYMIIEKYGDYSITIPQEEELVKEITESISNLGAREITSSLRGGTVTYKATKYGHERITKYINRLSYNTPSIGLELAVVSLKLNKSNNSGIDWESLKAISGSPLTGQYISGNSVLDDNIRNGMEGSLSTYGLTSSKASLAYASSNLVVSAAINLLDTYGEAKTEQSIMLKTLAGREANFDTTQEIPYKSGSTSSNINSDGGIITQDSTTETVQVGLKIKMTPYYDVDNEIITMDVEFDSSSIDGFIDVGDGAQEPSIQKQNFKNKVKLRNDEVIILGGVTFDSTSQSITGMSIFDDDWGINGSKEEKSKTAMFIIIKPSVEVYGNFKEDKVIK